MEDFEPELVKFAAVDASIQAESSVHSVGPIALDSSVLCSQLLQYVDTWRGKYSDQLHKIAKVLARGYSCAGTMSSRPVRLFVRRLKWNRSTTTCRLR